ncbi:twin-arginine translocation signal domain-containing protein [Mesorhizobium sp. LHD-90]|uniref:twin-arginine translocation signal domain-containing protein n=1 Tax=Mesorhizobium sp. LHD-90 TaxID=3071414 RepID=UPI0027E0016B|nr:twin-arginine translocation signal domain-containing protein [Mesorhizobium sp. LHD-90]MDQ6437628.1 twin-arginine translocation signal domain-containing protein [Mesorhizobium sp. LHD-90]
MVTIYDRRPGISRRDLLKRGGAAGVGALLVISGTAVISQQDAWGLETTALKPETMATLIQMARDVYPHDQVPDKYYAIAVKSHDEAAAKDAAHKDLIEKGVADLDQRSGAGGYRGLGWEEERVKVLRQIEETPFFQAIRGGLVVGLYNQKEVWPIFGYEGESYSKGGYIARGFDDIEWL